MYIGAVQKNKKVLRNLVGTEWCVFRGYIARPGIEVGGLGDKWLLLRFDVRDGTCTLFGCG